MEQLEVEVLYNQRCESAVSMFDLRDVVAYIPKRVGLIPGRAWFGAGSAINMPSQVTSGAISCGS